MVVNSAVNAYYCLRIMVTMYFPHRLQGVQFAIPRQVGTGMAGVIALAVGVFPVFLGLTDRRGWHPCQTRRLVNQSRGQAVVRTARL